MQTPAAVESVGVNEGRARASLQSLRAPSWGLVAHTRPPVEQPSREAKEVLSGVLKITQRAMVKRKSYGSI